MRWMTDSALGKISTTSVRRLFSRLSRSIGLFNQILGQCTGGNVVWARRSSACERPSKGSVPPRGVFR